MSDEIHIESAMRHVDQTALQQWQAHLADDEVMDREDGGLGEVVLDSGSWLLEALMVFLFAQNDIMNWENVAVRAFRFMRRLAPKRMERRDINEAAGLRRGVRTGTGFDNPQFQALCQVNEYRDFFRKVLTEFMYPPRRRRLFRGTQTVYLLAWAYMPKLVSRERKAELAKAVEQDFRKWENGRLSFEDMARIFHQFDPEKYPAGPERLRARNKVRSRWSAMAKAALRRKIEDAGGKVGRECGKSASARAAMARSAVGNGNRKGNERS